MAEEKIPQHQHDDPDKEWDTEGMSGFYPAEGGVLASQGDQRGRMTPGGGITLKPGWQEGYFYAKGADGRAVVLPGGCVEAVCGGDGQQADRASLLAGFAQRGLAQPDEIYLAYPSDPLYVVFQRYAILSDGGRIDLVARHADEVRARMAEMQAASMPQSLSDGNTAHRIIAQEYERKHEAERPDIFTHSTSIGSILKRIRANGHAADPAALGDSERLQRPDITHAQRLHLFEIKPFNLYAQGVAEALYYQSIFHRAAVKGMTLGPVSEPGASGKALTENGELVWGCPTPGVIVYQFTRRPDKDPVRDPVNVPVPDMPWVPQGERPRTTPQHIPLTPSAPESTDPEIWDLNYWKRVTGITSTAALIVYLLISEGSRLFPPRNLVPIP